MLLNCREDSRDIPSEHTTIPQEIPALDKEFCHLTIGLFGKDLHTQEATT